MKGRRKLLILSILCAPLILGTISAIRFLYARGVFDLPSTNESISLGSSVAGSLQFGRRLPCWGPNFKSYSYIGCLLGRNSVNSRLQSTLIAAYADMTVERPDVKFIYGETGWPRGGGFWPHKSHENGFCVDFFVPVRTESQTSTLHTFPWNKFGYNIEFDSSGHLGELMIDYDAMARHILALDRHAQKNGLAIAFVIFDNPLQVELAKTPSGTRALQSVRFSRLPSWVRHDEHYHIEFADWRGTPSTSRPL